MDRRSRKALQGFLGSVAVEGGPERQYLDTLGPAIYQTEPVWRTVVICVRCQYISLIPSLPRRALTWACPSCGFIVPLAPPPEVLELKAPAHPRWSQRAH